MAKAFAILMFLVAFGLEYAFFATGAGGPVPENEVSLALGGFAGSGWLAAGGGLVFLFGLLLFVMPAEGRPYPTRDVVLVLSVAGCVALTVALWLGVARGLPRASLATLALGGTAQALLAFSLAIRGAVAAEKYKPVFIPGTIGAVLCTIFYLLLFVLGS